MKDSIGLYFQIEIGDSDQALFLIKESLKEIEELEQVGIPVAYLQLRAKELPSRLANKEIWLKIDSDRGTYMASHVSFEWEHAFLTTKKKVEERMLNDQVDFAGSKRFAKATLPMTKYSLAASGQY